MFWLCFCWQIPRSVCVGLMCRLISSQNIALTVRVSPEFDLKRFHTSHTRVRVNGICSHCLSLISCVFESCCDCLRRELMLSLMGELQGSE